MYLYTHLYTRIYITYFPCYSYDKEGHGNCLMKYLRWSSQHLCCSLSLYRCINSSKDRNCIFICIVLYLTMASLVFAWCINFSQKVHNCSSAPEVHNCNSAPEVHNCSSAPEVHNCSSAPEVHDCCSRNAKHIDILPIYLMPDLWHLLCGTQPSLFYR